MKMLLIDHMPFWCIIFTNTKRYLFLSFCFLMGQRKEIHEESFILIEFLNALPVYNDSEWSTWKSMKYMETITLCTIWLYFILFYLVIRWIGNQVILHCQSFNIFIDILYDLRGKVANIDASSLFMFTTEHIYIKTYFCS